MSTTVEKEWIAIDDDENVVEKAETRERLLEKIDTDRCPTCGHYTLYDYEIVAVPKAHGSLYI